MQRKKCAMEFTNDFLSPKFDLITMIIDMPTALHE